MARSDPRRIALLVVMIGAAVGFAWASAANAVVIGLSVGPVILLIACDVSLAAGLEVMLAGAAAGYFAAVAVLYPLP